MENDPEDFKEEKPDNSYPSVIMALVWHCHGTTCAECGYVFSQRCTLRELVREHIKQGFIFIEPSLS